MNAITVFVLTPPISHLVSGLLLCRHLVRLSRHAQRVAVVLTKKCPCMYVCSNPSCPLDILSPVKLKKTSKYKKVMFILNILCSLFIISCVTHRASRLFSTRFRRFMDADCVYLVNVRRYFLQSVFRDSSVGTVTGLRPVRPISRQGRWSFVFSREPRQILLPTQWVPGGSVGIATRCGLDCLVIESRWRRIFRTRPDRPWDPPSLLCCGYRVFLRG